MLYNIHISICWKGDKINVLHTVLHVYDYISTGVFQI